MLIKGSINACDICMKTDVSKDGFYALSRGATGRVCCVLFVCNDCKGEDTVVTVKEAKEWAESQPGGYLDIVI